MFLFAKFSSSGSAPTVFAMAEIDGLLDGDAIATFDLEANGEESQVTPNPKTEKKPEKCLGTAVVVGIISMALITVALWFIENDTEKKSKHGLRFLQAVGGGSAIGSCWLKCGTAVGKTIHSAGAFIARLCVNLGGFIHSMFLHINDAFGNCCGTMGDQLERCPSCGGCCSHFWNASGRCMGGCCMSIGNLINGGLVVCGTSISGCCDVFAGFFSGMWSSCGNFLSETCPFWNTTSSFAKICWFQGCQHTFWQNKPCWFQTDSKWFEVDWCYSSHPRKKFSIVNSTFHCSEKKGAVEVWLDCGQQKRMLFQYESLLCGGCPLPLLSDVVTFWCFCCLPLDDLSASFCRYLDGLRSRSSSVCKREIWMAPLKRFPMIHLCNKYYSNSRYQMVSLIREFWNHVEFGRRQK